MTQPLKFGEIPEIPESVTILFVGVAPTAARGKHRGTHFYSSQTDLLRTGLFAVLDREYHSALIAKNLRCKERADEEFHSSGFFFVHSAKVRPLEGNAPPTDAVACCAAEHLAVEIPVIAPRAVCFLGKNNTRHAAEQLFNARVTDTPQWLTVGPWNGWVAVAEQPVRGWGPRTQRVVAALKRQFSEGGPPTQS